MIDKYKSLKKTFKKIEKQRQLYLVLMVLSIIISTIYFAIYILGENSNSFNFNDILIPFIILLGWLFIPLEINFIYKKNTKKVLEKEILNLYTGFQFEEKEEALNDDITFIKKLELFDKIQYCKCYKKIRGINNNIPIDIIFTELSNTSKLGYTSQKDITFKGIYAKFPSSKNIKHTICIKDDMKTMGISENKVITEHSKFEKYFNVFAGDSKETRLLLTEEFMQKMAEIAKNKTSIILSEEYGFINIGIYFQEIEFKLSILKPLKEYKNLKKIINNIDNILILSDIINEIKQYS